MKLIPNMDDQARTIMNSRFINSWVDEVENVVKTSGQTLYPDDNTTFAVSTITRAGQVATLTTIANHNLVNLMTINVVGAVETEYNVTAKKILVTGPTTLNYIVTGTPATPATGTIFMTPVDDFNQAPRSMADYLGAADFYAVSGTPDAIILTPTGTFEPPHKYRNGLDARFRPTAPNTGATTVEIRDASGQAIGPTPITIKKDGGSSDLGAGDLAILNEVEISFSESPDIFRLVRNRDVSGTGTPDTILGPQFSQNLGTTTGLTFGFNEGKLRKEGDTVTIAAGTLLLPATNDSTIFLDTTDNTVKSVLTGSYLSTTEKFQLFEVTTDGAAITVIVDKRSYSLDLTSLTTFISSQFAQDTATTTGLTFGFNAGRVSKDNDIVSLAAGTTLLPDDETSIVYFDADTNTVKDDLIPDYNILGIEKFQLFEIVTAGGIITNIMDERTPFHIPKRFQENLIINPNVAVWQREEPTPAIVGATTEFTADRFKYTETTGGTTVALRAQHTLGQTDVPGNHRFFWRADRQVAGSGSTVLNIEIEEISQFSNTTLTIEFFVRFGSASTLGVAAVSHFGSTGSADVVTDIDTAFNVGTSFTRCLRTFTVPDMTGKTISGGVGRLDLRFTFPNVVDLFDISDVTLVTGDFLSDVFERSEGEQEFLCSRYVFKTYNRDVTPGSASAPGVIFGFATNKEGVPHDLIIKIVYSNRMLTTPTVQIWDVTGLSNNLLSSNLSSSFAGIILNIGDGNFSVGNNSASSTGLADRHYGTQALAIAEIA